VGRLFLNKGTNLKTKRAQKALGRSPEEKVKGHSGEIYRVPLVMLYTKYESSVVSDKEDF